MTRFSRTIRQNTRNGSSAASAATSPATRPAVAASGNQTSSSPSHGRPDACRGESPGSASSATLQR